MANITTVTRPYAKAILDLAKLDDTYSVWTDMLDFLSALVLDPSGHKIISNLAISPAEKIDFIFEVSSGRLTKQGENLIKILARGKRLLILPELFNLYEGMRKDAEGLIFIDITLAQDIDKVELDSIRDICGEYFTGSVILSEHVDPGLISGGIAKIGNRIIDASINGRLHAMRNLLTNK